MIHNPNKIYNFYILTSLTLRCIFCTVDMEIPETCLNLIESYSDNSITPRTEKLAIYNFESMTSNRNNIILTLPEDFYNILKTDEYSHRNMYSTDLFENKLTFSFPFSGHSPTYQLINHVTNGQGALAYHTHSHSSHFNFYFSSMIDKLSIIEENQYKIDTLLKPKLTEVSDILEQKYNSNILSLSYITLGLTVLTFSIIGALYVSSGILPVAV